MINQMEPWFGEEERQAINEYMASGGWLTEFQKTRQFEEMLAKYIGSQYCHVLSNGTVTLYTALAALDIGPGDEVIVPDYTMIASSNAVLLAGAKPVFVDVQLNNLCLDLDQTENAITPHTKAIMAVSLNGRAPNMHELVSLANRHNVFLIEDAAQSLGSRFQGKHLGTFGIMGSFSFSVPKVITTGQGGALVTDDSQLSQRIRRIKDFGRAKSGVDFHESVGFNFKFTDLQAVIGIEQMKKLEWRVERKKLMFALYREELRDLPMVHFVDTNLEDISPWFMDILVPDPLALGNFLKSRGIGTRPMYPAIHSQPAYNLPGNFPNSEYIAKHGLWLPSSSFLSDDVIRQVCSSIGEFYSGKQE